MLVWLIFKRFGRRLNEMKKEDNNWSLSERKTILAGSGDYEHFRNVEINDEKYFMPEHFAGLCHSILLLVDAINDKKIK